MSVSEVLLEMIAAPAISFAAVALMYLLGGATKANRVFHPKSWRGILGRGSPVTGFTLAGMGSHLLGGA